MSANGWGQWANYVLKELEENNKEHGEFRAMQSEIAVLKTKAGVWGLAAGSIPALITLTWAVLNKLGVL